MKHGVGQGAPTVSPEQAEMRSQGGSVLRKEIPRSAHPPPSSELGVPEPGDSCPHLTGLWQASWSGAWVDTVSPTAARSDEAV